MPKLWHIIPACIREHAEPPREADPETLQQSSLTELVLITKVKVYLLPRPSLPGSFSITVGQFLSTSPPSLVTSQKTGTIDLYENRYG